MTDRIIYVKGRRIDQAKLRKFLDGYDLSTCELDDGTWKSPISGEIFATQFAMAGSFGTYLREHVELDPDEPNRAGYMRAKRDGRDPTQEQRLAHNAYVRARRKGGPKHAEAVAERVTAVLAEPSREDKRDAQRADRKERKATEREASDELLTEIAEREEQQHAAAVDAMELATKWASDLAEVPIDNSGGL